MAIKKIYFGTLGPFEYDDTDPINDEDGDFPGENYRAITTNDQLLVERAPAIDEEVLRLIDLGYRVLPPVSVANINNPTELNAVAGDLGTMVLVYEIVGAGGLNEYTIYVYDASGPAVNSPYVVDADGAGAERWIALAGKYFAQNLNISGSVSLTGTVDGVDIAVHAANINAHHNKAHAHNGADGSGTVAHSDTTGQGVNDHHAQLHNAASHSDIASSGANIDDAVAKRHTQGTDISVGALTIYANNAAAIVGGLGVNDLYRNGADPDLVCVVH